MKDVVLAIHGGLGEPRSRVSAEHEAELKAGLAEALLAGGAALSRPGATALDAVEAAIVVMEDCPHFNAGRGSVYTREGQIEMDASIMTGDSRRAGCVAGLTRVRYPIRAARAVMEHSPHVLMIGPGAEAFAAEQSLELVDPSYFYTERRWNEHLRQLERERQAAAKAPARPDSWGTVGAVALDQAGNLAAGTSTGGVSDKRPGRVGDSPIIGAGTFADNRSCAVSCTGQGELFLRLCAAHEIAAKVRYQSLNLQVAVDQVIRGDLAAWQGEGGVIALDPRGNAAFAFTGSHLFRGYLTRQGQVVISLFDDSP